MEAHIINDAGRQTAPKNQRKYMFFCQISPDGDLYSCFEGIYYLSTKKRTLRKFTKLAGTTLLIITLPINQKKTFLISKLSNEYNI